MFISVSCFTLGGYTLINSNFHTLLNNEVQTAYDFGDIVNYSLYNELKTLNINSIEEDEYQFLINSIVQVANSISVNNTNQKILFCIMQSDGQIIFSSLTETLDKELLASLEQNQKGWSIKKTEDNIYVQTIRPATFLGNEFFIETIRDVTYIFNNQNAQYGMLLKIIIGMFIFAGLVTMIISKILMGQINSLIKVTKDISEGDLSKRVGVKNNDEFSLLSQNFNFMADKLEEKIHELQDEAEKRSLFVGAFSHEVKTPLTSIIGYADMLRRKEMDKERIHLCAENIFMEGKRLETLSMRLLEIIVLQNQEINFKPVKIKQLFEEVHEVVFPKLERTGIEFLCDVENAVVEMEPELIKTVFINLIDNGIKAIEGYGQIRIDGKRYDDMYIVTIQDTGKGMEKQELSKIKEPFYMVDKSRTRKQGGAGLGLALCDEIIKLHGFNMSFESTLNIGTNITVTMNGVKVERKSN